MDLNYISNTIALGDGDDGLELTDATYHKESLPVNWLTDKSKPSYRHLDGANYAFGDGHVKWMKPQNVSHAPAKSDIFTFAIK